MNSEKVLLIFPDPISFLSILEQLLVSFACSSGCLFGGRLAYLWPADETKSSFNSIIELAK